MYTDEQLLAINSNDKHIACLACAGSGKTTVLLERVSRLISEGVSASNILVLTFTNAASKELTVRYRCKYSTRLIPTFCTFHSFCYQLLIDDTEIRKYLGYTQIPQIADESKMKQVEATARIQTNCKLSKSKLAGKESLQPKDKFPYDLYHKALKNIYIKNNLITFDTLLSSIAQLFIDNNALITSYKSKYYHILVDEFQDTSYYQWNFVRSFTDSNIFVCGDISQNIYSFRGTTNRILKDLIIDTSWTTIYLTSNFRSTQQICDYANDIFKDQDTAIDMKAICTGDPVVTDTFRYIPYMQMIDTSKLNRIADLLNSMKGTSAILCRTNKEVEAISEYLIDLGISVDSNASYKDIGYLLHSVYDNNFMIDWISSLLPMDAYENFIRYTILNSNKSKLELLLNTFTSNTIRNYINIIIHIRKIMKESTATNTSRFWDILKLLKIPVEIDESIVVDNQLNAKEVIATVERYIVSNLESILYIGTVHSVKGLEFNNVFVIGINGSTWDIEKEDNRNLFYVACTRAKDNLFVYEGV